MVCNKSIAHVLWLQHLQFIFCLSIYEGVKRTLQCMPKKVSNHPTSFIFDVKPFQRDEFKSQRFKNFDNMYLSIRRFLKI